MVLEEVRLIPPEELERARAEAEKQPEIDVVEEQTQLLKVDLHPKPKNPMEEVFSAIRTQFPEFAEMMKSVPSASGRVMRVRGPVPISPMIEVYFTPEQYVELGSPGLLSIVKVSMTVLASDT
jgi:hypothetical protein